VSDTLIFEALDLDDRQACLSIRLEVFCVEQKVSIEIEFDGLDDECRHYLATQNGRGVGTARARMLNDTEIKLERIAVQKVHRKSGIGRLLVIRAISDAAQKGYASAFLNSQVHACQFYAKLGFEADSDIFYEAGIPHRSMRRKL